MKRKEKIKILLFWPGIGNIGYPLGLPILNELLLQTGNKIEIFQTNKFHTYPQNTRGMLYKSSPSKDIKLSKDLYDKEFNEGVKEFIQKVEQFKPDIIAMSAFSTNFLIGLEYYRSLKKQIFFLVGGVHPTLVPDEVISIPEVDAICIGDGEEMIVKFMERCQEGALEMRKFNNIPNLWFKTKNHSIIKHQVSKVTDINKLPVPNYDNFNPLIRHYRGRKVKTIVYELSRGCPQSCSFCCNKNYMKTIYRNGKPRIRRKEIRNVIEQLIVLKQRYEIGMFKFVDENFFTASLEWFEEFSTRYKNEIDIPFTISTTANLVTEKKVKFIKEAGCINVNMGPESGNEEYRKKVLKKPISDKMYLRAKHLFEEYDIRVGVGFIIGLPMQTKQIIKDTVLLLKKLRTSAHFEFFTPLPGSELYDQLTQQGKYAGFRTGYDCYKSLGHPVFVPEGTTKEELIGYSRTLLLYAHLPETLHPIIKLCEIENEQTNNLLDALEAIFWL